MTLQFEVIQYLTIWHIMLPLIDASCSEFTIINNTNLLTGIYYRISLPTSTFSALTYEDAPVTGGVEFIEMDDDAGSETMYSKGGDWYLDGIWMLKPAEEEGYVTIHLALDPDKVIAVTSARKSPTHYAPKDYYLILLSSAGAGRRDRNSIQWKISPGYGSDVYSIRNLDFEVKAATTEKWEDGYLWVKMEFIESSDFELFSTQFKFTAVTVEL